MGKKAGIIIGLGAAAVITALVLAKPAAAADGMWTCPYCDAEFSEYDELVSHVHIHVGERMPISIGWR